MMVKLPNFLRADPDAFDRQKFVDEAAEFPEDDMRIRLLAENTIRWRFAQGETSRDVLVS
jgi:hypothetical protein